MQTQLKHFYQMAIVLMSVVLTTAGGVGCKKTVPAISFSRLRALPPFQASVQKIEISDFREKGIVVAIVLSKADGSKIHVMQVNASTQDVAFAKSLTQGQSYAFPSAMHK